MPRILLDRNNEASPSDEFLIIDTEVAFLKYATSGKPLFIRGKRLCDWAQVFYTGRKVAYEEAFSPASDLLKIYSDLTPLQAGFILSFVEKRHVTLQNVSALEILEACYPMPLWESPTSLKHAAEWLLWLDETEPNDAFQPMFKVITSNWRNASPELAELYSVQDTTNAREILKSWLGACITPFLERYGKFPLPYSDKWVEILTQAWRMEMVKTNGEFLSTFLKTQTPREFKELVALIALEYFEKNADPDTFTLEKYDHIARFVSGNDRARLSAIKPVPVPSDLPQTAEEVLQWFASEYLPYREWQINTNATNAYPQVLKLGSRFAHWYLDFYPKAITSKKHLSFFKSKNLKEQNTNSVDLLVILDGLHAVDAKFLMDALLRAKRNQQLSMMENSYCFAPLPTVTDFAKGALVHGVQPTLMKDLELLGEDVSEQQTPLPKLKNAKPGSLFIWRIQDPDRTYHTKNKFSLLKTEVEGELSTIAKKVLDIAEEISPSVSLRIIITTDHGRFLGISQRTIDVPSGMQAHGRAAWGDSKVVFDKSGYKIDGEIVYLSKDRFGLLSDDAAVILTDCAFQHEKYSQEKYPHGGLFPEEVIIPWMVFERGVAKPELEFTLSGDGQANTPGKVLISAINTSSFELTIVSVEMNFGIDKEFSVKVQKAMPSLKTTNFEIEIPSWPSSEQVSSGKCWVLVRLPSGEELTVIPPLAGIKVSEIYTRDKSLFEDLGL